MDRSIRATLTLTMPGRNEVVYKGFIDHVVRNFSLSAIAFDDKAQLLMEPDPVPILSHVNDVAEQEHLLPSMDSELEAFSRNPTHVASQHWLLSQPHLPNIRTRCSSRTDLDY